MEGARSPSIRASNATPLLIWTDLNGVPGGTAASFGLAGYKLRLTGASKRCSGASRGSDRDASASTPVELVLPHCPARSVSGGSDADQVRGDAVT